MQGLLHVEGVTQPGGARDRDGLESQQQTELGVGGQLEFGGGI